MTSEHATSSTSLHEHRWESAYMGRHLKCLGCGETKPTEATVGEWSDIVYGRTPSLSGKCPFKRPGFFGRIFGNPHTCQLCGDPSGWHRG